MQSNNSSELPSAYSAYTTYNPSTVDGRAANLSKKKQVKGRKSDKTQKSSNTFRDENDTPVKRKFHSAFESESEDEPSTSQSTSRRTRKARSNEQHCKSSLNSSPQSQPSTSRARNGSSDPTPKSHLSKCTDNGGDQKSAPYTVSKTNYSASLNLTPLTSSIEEGQKLFGVLIKPLVVQMFMAKYWERKPIRVDRKCRDYYKDLISTEAIDKMLRENHVEYTKNIDITSYKDGVRETMALVGRAMPPRIWHYYGEGCSIRILNPQTFLPAIHSMNAALQEYFQCMTGANVYLTPPNSQGFAPHYDDIEAFVLQIEGKKHWRIYPPKSRNETLPRVSSKNLDQTEIGEPCLEVVLEAGDLLYFPRGFIHQASTVENQHSLHITVSVYQKQTYGDLLEILLPMALKEAITENVTLRRGVPLNIWQRMGLVNNDIEDFQAERNALINQIKACFETVSRYVKTDNILDDAIDQMALRYQHDALPPKLTPEEELRSVYSTKTTNDENGELNCPYIDVDTKIRLIRANVLRMVRHGGEFRIYYSSENSKEYHGFDENFLDIDPSDAPAVEVLIKSYPSFVTPAYLQLENIDKNLAVAQDLWEKGILMTDEPLPLGR